MQSLVSLDVGSGDHNLLTPASAGYKEYTQNNIDFVTLNRRLNCVKKEFGLRRAVSSRSLTGETRTFAEILDQEVEKIVMFYLTVQGNLAKRVWEIRSFQLDNTIHLSLSVDSIGRLTFQYREVAREVLDLLNFLDRNTISLKHLIKRHDQLFDQKLGSMYFNTRMGREGKNYQLIQLYQQEGVQAIITTIRKGFEELYDAKNALTGVTDAAYTQQQPTRRFSAGGSSSVPRISYKNKLLSFSSLQSLAAMEAGQSTTAVDNIAEERMRSKSTNQLSALSQPGSIAETKLFHNKNKCLKKSISDLEPILKQIDEAANQVTKSQRQSTAGYLVTHSELAFDVSESESEEEEEEELAELDKAVTPAESRKQAGLKAKMKRMFRVTTSQISLYINLFVTFLFMANQYIVAPTSGQYASLLGMTAALSGVIIGMTPAAVLFSSLGYSLWTNYSFKSPLLVCILCGMLGNLFYGMALQCDSLTMLLMGRLLTGFAGTRVVARRYIADHVSLADRLVASSQFVTVSALGMAFGPLMASLIERSEVQFEWVPFKDVSGGNRSVWREMWGIRYQNETAPGWLMFILWTLSFIAVFFLFKNPEKHVPLEQDGEDGTSPNALINGDQDSVDVDMIDNVEEIGTIEKERKAFERSATNAAAGQGFPSALKQYQKNILPGSKISGDEGSGQEIELSEVSGGATKKAKKTPHTPVPVGGLTYQSTTPASTQSRDHHDDYMVGTGHGLRSRGASTDIHHDIIGVEAGLELYEPEDADLNPPAAVKKVEKDVAKKDGSGTDGGAIAQPSEPLPKGGLKGRVLAPNSAPAVIRRPVAIDKMITSVNPKQPADSSIKAPKSDESTISDLTIPSGLYDMNRQLPLSSLETSLSSDSTTGRERQGFPPSSHLTINVGCLSSNDDFTNNSSPYYQYAKEQYLREQQLKEYNAQHPYKNIFSTRPSLFSYFFGKSGEKNGYSELTTLEPQQSPRKVANGGKKSPSLWSHVSLEVCVILLLYVINKAAQELTVASIPYLTKILFGWTSETAGYYMGVLGALVLPTNILIHYLVRESEDRDLLLRLSYVTVFAVMCIVDITITQYTESQYIFGTLLLFSILTSVDGTMMSLLSKLVSPKLAKGTFNSALLATEAGTLGRVIGDVMITGCASLVHPAVPVVDMLFLPILLGLIATVIAVHLLFHLLVV